MLFADTGEVYECVRSHVVFTANGDLVALGQGELVIIVEAENFMATSIRVETGQIVKTMLLEIFGVEPTFVKVWP